MQLFHPNHHPLARITVDCGQPSSSSQGASSLFSSLPGLTAPPRHTNNRILPVGATATTEEKEGLLQAAARPRSSFQESVVEFFRPSASCVAFSLCTLLLISLLAVVTTLYVRVTRSLDGNYNIGAMARNVDYMASQNARTLHCSCALFSLLRVHCVCVLQVDYMLNNSAALTETLLGMVRESHPLVLDTLNDTKRTISSVSRLIERPTISLG